MENLHRFTTVYRKADDRILMTGEDRNGETVSLWLTQRLLLKAVPVMTEWLQANNPADLRTAENSAQASAIAELFSREPVRPRQELTDTATTSPGVESAVARTAPLLVDNIDLRLNKKFLRLRFRQGDQEVGCLTLNGSQLRQWMAVLQLLWKNAGWPPHVWPRWLSEDIKLVSNRAGGTFH